ncbi:sirohydrochlorin chelatase [Microlunatus soli]|uniref:Sirohydrochlorin ferrochelatase n=1 Tax=Microlunatus soli TaxID=630515 RepID=A0A1H2AQG4_9ACTN|nr:CbiX/SirB N-terminal domain-containing protein [Microlunatus soli]SDT48059.1 Sirohydrochlorin ferrochelatase [Microlunatus soli]
MTAPALVLLSNGGGDPRVAAVSQGLRAGLNDLRPELDVRCAFADNPPTALQVINKLTQRGVNEVVLTPLSIADAFSGGDDLGAMLTAVRAAHPGLQVVASQPIGPDPKLLSVVDRRLRDALKARRATELDGLVFLSDNSHDTRSHAVVARRTRLWGSHHRLPSVTAFGGDHGPTAAEAVRTLHAQGRRHVAVGSWYLSPTEDYLRQARMAYEAGAIAVSEPLGPEPELLQTIISRYVVSAMDLVDLEPMLAERRAAPHLAVVGA